MDKSHLGSGGLTMGSGGLAKQVSFLQKGEPLAKQSESKNEQEQEDDFEPKEEFEDPEEGFSEDLSEFQKEQFKTQKTNQSSMIEPNGSSSKLVKRENSFKKKKNSKNKRYFKQKKLFRNCIYTILWFRNLALILFIISRSYGFLAIEDCYEHRRDLSLRLNIYENNYEKYLYVTYDQYLSNAFQMNHTIIPNLIFGTLKDPDIFGYPNSNNTFTQIQHFVNYWDYHKFQPKLEWIIAEEKPI